MIEPSVPRSHPRYLSLKLREAVAEGLDRGLVARAGLIAHGRGEAFDYLLGETTTPEAEEAERAAAALLFLAERPVISVNGNASVLAREPLAELAQAVGAPIEINLFYRTDERVGNLAAFWEEAGIEPLGVEPDALIPGLDHARGSCSREGIFAADVVLVPLEDGDRTQALKAMGKRVVSIDLNPLSRTALASDVTVVDNLVRAVPAILASYRGLSVKDGPERALATIQGYDNRSVLRRVLARIAERLTKEADRTLG